MNPVTNPCRFPQLALRLLAVTLSLSCAPAHAENLENAVKAALLRSRPPGYRINRFQMGNVTVVRTYDEINFGDLEAGLHPDSIRSGEARFANCTDQEQPKDLAVTVKTTLSSETQISRSVETSSDLSVDIGIPIPKLLTIGIKSSVKQTVKINTQETQRTTREDSASITEHFKIPPKTVFFLLASRAERTYSGPFSGRALIDADVNFELQRNDTTVRTRGTVKLHTWLSEPARVFDFAGRITGIGATEIEERTNSRPVNPSDPNDCVPVPSR